jgi:hypothetical protein
MIKIPEEIKELRLKKLELEKKQANIMLDIAKIEIQVASAVLSAVNEKEKPLFSNEAARKAEIAKRLGEDNKHMGLNSIELPDINRHIKQLDAELEYQYNLLKIHLAQSCPLRN